MTNIQINEIKSVGYSFFEDSESFLDDLSEEELSFSKGGIAPIWVIFFSSEACGLFVFTAATVILQPDVE